MTAKRTLAGSLVQSKDNHLPPTVGSRDSGSAAWGSVTESWLHCLPQLLTLCMWVREGSSQTTCVKTNWGACEKDPISKVRFRCSLEGSVLYARNPGLSGHPRWQLLIQQNSSNRLCPVQKQVIQTETSSRTQLTVRVNTKQLDYCGKFGRQKIH